MNGPCKMTRTVHVRPSGKLNKEHSTIKNNGFSGSFLHIFKSIQKKKIIEFLNAHIIGLISLYSLF